jgi:hypothetical protein
MYSIFPMIISVTSSGNYAVRSILLGPFSVDIFPEDIFSEEIFLEEIFLEGLIFDARDGLRGIAVGTKQSSRVVT